MSAFASQIPQQEHRSVIFLSLQRDPSKIKHPDKVTAGSNVPEGDIAHVGDIPELLVEKPHWASLTLPFASFTSGCATEMQ